MRLAKRNKTERETVVAMAAKGICICGCGCNKMCPCPPIPTHAVGLLFDELGYGRQTQSGTGSRASN